MQDFLIKLISSSEFLGALSGVMLAQYLTQRHSKKADKDKVRQEIFTEYGERYSKIMGEIVKNYTKLEEESFDFKNKEQRKNVTEYFLLISDQYTLYLKGLVTPEVWSVWRGNIEKQMKSRFFQEAWVYVESQVDFSNEFSTYLDYLVLPYEKKMLYEFLQNNQNKTND